MPNQPIKHPLPGRRRMPSAPEGILVLDCAAGFARNGIAGSWHQTLYPGSRFLAYEVGSIELEFSWRMVQPRTAAAIACTPAQIVATQTAQGTGVLRIRLWFLSRPDLLPKAAPKRWLASRGRALPPRSNRAGPPSVLVACQGGVFFVHICLPSFSIVASKDGGISSVMTRSISNAGSSASKRATAR